MIIAIDVGGTKISAALIHNNKIIEQRKIESVIHNDLANLSQHLYALCENWISKANQLSVACTGQVGSEYVGFLSAKQKLPLKSQLEAKFNLPVTIINDAAAAAWAEHHVRQTAAAIKESHDTLVYITVSTGIGGGIIQNGRLVTSTNGFSAHLGHISVQHLNQCLIPCHCGRINCAEAISSGTAIAKQASLILNKTVTCKDVFQDYMHIEQIKQLIDECTSAITDLIANIKATTGTEVVIMGGSVGSSSVFFEQVQKKIQSLPDIYQVRLLRPQCGANADLLGAYWYVYHTPPLPS